MTIDAFVDNGHTPGREFSEQFLLSPEFTVETLKPILSCYAAKFDNHNLLELCGAGILPARIIQTKCTTAYQVQVG
ncbi:MAG: hypothetical protein PT119_02380 [Aphanizomenon gracile PMC627.10]|nr:hypothetical protein [Aphanizomenon gracile PMC627.10]